MRYLRNISNIENEKEISNSTDYCNVPYNDHPFLILNITDQQRCMYKIHICQVEVRNLGKVAFSKIDKLYFLM